MCITKEAECETQSKMRKIQTIITAEQSIVQCSWAKELQCTRVSPQTIGWVSLISHSRASFLPCLSSSAPTTSRHCLWYSFTQSRCRTEERPSNHEETVFKSCIIVIGIAANIITLRCIVHGFNIGQLKLKCFYFSHLFPTLVQ